MKNYTILLLAYLLLSGCASLAMEHVTVENTGDIDGTYNLIMVGGTFVADAERIVILDAANDNNTFRPVTFPGRVNIVSGLGAEEALQKAEMFFAEHCAYDGFQIKKLSRPDGGFIGYELIPDFPPSLCEDGNVMQVGYGPGDEGETKVYTWLLLKRDNSDSRIDNAVISEE